MAEKIKAGEVIVLPVGQTPEKVPDGLIHDWIGTAFVGDASIEAVLSTVRNYGHYRDFYHPAVMQSHLRESDSGIDRYSIVLASKSLGDKAALDGDYTSTYVKVDDRHWYSFSETTRLQEIQHYGAPEQQMLSETQGNGLIWKLSSITCFEQRDDGVYVEIEAIALSRNIPLPLQWIATSIVRGISKSSLATSLRQTGDAVHSRNQFLASAATASESRWYSSHKDSPKIKLGTSFR